MAVPCKNPGGVAFDDQRFTRTLAGMNQATQFPVQWSDWSLLVHYHRKKCGLTGETVRLTLHSWGKFPAMLCPSGATTFNPASNYGHREP
jgi:hypothetical protein